MSSEARNFLESLFAGKPDELYLLLCLTDDEEPLWFDDLEDAIECAEPISECDVFVGVGLAKRKYGAGLRCPSEDVAGIVGVFANIDLRSDAHPRDTLPRSVEQALANSGRLIKEGGAEAVKLEGGITMAETIRRVVDIDIPVMGHIGLTPQSIHRMGGHRVQGRKSGKSAGCRERLLEDAAAIEQAGAFAMVLEGIPADLAREITEHAAIPTIGIGAGVGCDGQVLVMHDVLGLSESFLPRFAKPYANLWQDASAAATSYIREVRERSFPTPEHSYGLKGA